MISGQLLGRVAVGGARSARGRLQVQDADPGEAGMQTTSIKGEFGTLTVSVGGGWQYKLTDIAEVARQRAQALEIAQTTGQTPSTLIGEALTEKFNVLSIDGSASVQIVIKVTMSAHPGDLTFTGTDAAEFLYGGGDNDTLSGRGGDDSLYGLEGNDTLIGGSGVDRLIGGSGTDTASYADAPLGVAIDLQVARQDLLSTGGDILSSIENITGSRFGDILAGDKGANVINGGRGWDMIDGRGVADLMIGGLGNDTYYVDNAADGILEEAGEGNSDAIYSSVGYTICDNVENMYLTGARNVGAFGNALENWIAGNQGNNTLLGLAGDDFIEGSAGDDRLSGGEGKDILYGGVGRDTFLLDAAPVLSNRDYIEDFQPGSDKIEISRTAYGAFSDGTPGALADTDIAFGNRASTASQHLIYNNATGRLYYDADGNGSAEAVLVAIFKNNPELTLADFVLV